MSYSTDNPDEGILDLGSLSSAAMRWKDAEGRAHRIGGPAIIAKAGMLEWYYHGKRHRLDGPAVDAPEFQEWYRDGVRHREGGPAVIYPTYQAYYCAGRLHRLDGPACVSLNKEGEVAYENWAVAGKIVHNESLKQWAKDNNIDPSTEDGLAFLLFELAAGLDLSSKYLER